MMSTRIWTEQTAALIYYRYGVYIPNLAKHDIQFQIGDLGSDYLPIEVSTDVPPHGNSSINHTK